MATSQRTDTPGSQPTISKTSSRPERIRPAAPSNPYACGNALELATARGRMADRITVEQPMGPAVTMNNQTSRADRSQEGTEGRPSSADRNGWPPRPGNVPELLTPVEAAQYLRLDETGDHTPLSAVRTLNYWRQRGELKATKFARRVWFRRAELDRFLAVKTET